MAPFAQQRPGGRVLPARVRRTAFLLLSLALVRLCVLPWSQSVLCYTVPSEFGQFTLKVDRLLGSGAFGSVYECADKTGKGRAVKVIPMWRMQEDTDKEEKRTKLEHEIEVHLHIGPHPNVVQLVDSVDIAGDLANWPRWKMIVMELARGGELSKMIEKTGKLDEAKSKHIFKQIVDAVKHLHTRNVIHRDLKTDNILLCTDSTGHTADRPFVKLIDFGAGHWAKAGPLEATTCTGTLQTMAPEVLLARGDDFDLSDASQIAALHEVEFRTRPFGINKYAPAPNGKGCRVIEIIERSRYKGDPLGQSFTKGVKNGWVVKTVGGVDVSNMDFEDIRELMGDKMVDMSSIGLAQTAAKITGKAEVKVDRPKVQPAALPLTVQFAEMKAKPYGAKVDVWSLGCVLYNMLSGENPFPPSEEMIKAGRYTPLTGVSPQLNDLISKMLVVNPAQRMSLDDVAKHPWLR